MDASMHIAQINVGRIRGLEGDPQVADFFANLDAVNALAERMPGFVWRLKDASAGGVGNATGIKVSDHPRDLANMSVWETPDQLATFVFQTLYVRFYRRAAEFFEPPSGVHFAAWHVAKGYVPTLEEGLAKLVDLRSNGASERVFGWEHFPGAAELAARRCA